MLRFLLLILFTSLTSAAALAQDVRYISDKQYIPVRSGAGGDYRIVHRGLPSGTRVTVSGLSADGDWAEISSAGGTSGWIRTQYLMEDVPAQVQLRTAEQRVSGLEEQNNELRAELTQLQGEQTALVTSSSTTEGKLRELSEELAQLKQISGNAVQLDADNRRLAEEAENLRSTAGMLQSENQRLQEKLRSGAFLDGALAVLLGVIITLVVPRLWPKRKRNTGWA